jgi:hypothetical protein
MTMAPEDVDWMAGKIREQAFEIMRLREWLEWLGGEMAQRALRGDPVPQPREPHTQGDAP